MPAPLMETLQLTNQDGRDFGHTHQGMYDKVRTTALSAACICVCACVCACVGVRVNACECVCAQQRVLGEVDVYLLMSGEAVL